MPCFLHTEETIICQTFYINICIGFYFIKNINGLQITTLHSEVINGYKKLYNPKFKWYCTGYPRLTRFLHNSDTVLILHDSKSINTLIKTIFNILISNQLLLFVKYVRCKNICNISCISPFVHFLNFMKLHTDVSGYSKNPIQRKPLNSEQNF